MAEVFDVAGNSSGTYTGPVDKALVHTTEGGSIEGAVSAYRANNSWPHKTVDCRFGKPYRIARHLPLHVPARSLRNESGGVQTNRDGVVQYEIVGSATRPHEIDWVWFGANVLGPDCRAMGVPIQSSVSWVAYPASYGERANQRLTGSGWASYRGVLGHQHCPENSHGDPGAIPIDDLLAAANGTPALPEGFLMALSDQEQAYLYERMIRVEKALAKALGSGDEYLGYKDGIRTELRSLPDAPLVSVATVAGVDTALSNDRASGSAARQGVRSLAALGSDDALGARVAAVEAKLDAILVKLG